MSSWNRREREDGDTVEDYVQSLAVSRLSTPAAPYCRENRRVLKMTPSFSLSDLQCAAVVPLIHNSFYDDQPESLPAVSTTAARVTTCVSTPDVQVVV